MVSQAGSTGSSARAVTLALPAFGQENEQKQSLWQTEFGTLTLVQEGPMVWGTFDYHGGRVIGSMHGGKLYGYWREDDDTTGVGPYGAWCGPFVFVFDASGSSFKGNYGKHARAKRDPQERFNRPDAAIAGRYPRRCADRRFSATLRRGSRGQMTPVRRPPGPEPAPLHPRLSPATLVGNPHPGKELAVLKFGIIGAGMIAPSGVEGAKKSGKAEVVAVADTHPGRLASFAAKHGIPKTYPKAEDLIRDKGIEAVYIAVPNAFHAPYAIAALEAGKHVILDKPFATSYAEAVKVIEAARKSGKVFTVGMNQRFTEGAQKVRTLVERGYFGEIYRMRAFWRRRWGAPRLGTWFGNRKLSGGGCFLDVGVHMLDLALYTAGDFDAESVTGAVYTKFGNRGLGEGGWGASDPEGMPFDVDDCALAFIRMKSGASVQVEISWAALQKEENSYNVEIFGTEAGAQAYPGEVYRFDRDLGAHVEAGSLRVPLKYPHANRFVNFFRAILGEEELCVTHEQALKVQRIIDAVYESSAARREIRL